MRPPGSVAIVGGGAFGLAAALELRLRDYEVSVVDRGVVPHPQASSTDISKAVRMDYGRDLFYADLAELALERWRAWNRATQRPLFHEIGILMITRGLMAPGSFESDSFETMLERRVPVERLNASGLARRFPAWRKAGFSDGYFNPAAGWVASGEAVAFLADEAREAGVAIREGAPCKHLVEDGSRVKGIVLDDGEEIRADWVVVAAGAWTPRLLPYLSPVMWPIGQPVVHLRPPDRRPFEGERFPVWCADISTTGWYGFPVTTDGVLKIANHGPGREIGQGDPLEPNDGESGRVIEFVSDCFPELARAPVAGGRLCLYCDTFDGNFLIDHDPERPGLIVAAGGNGHGFKFTPVLGEIVADVLEHKQNRWAGRFAWRDTGDGGGEQARCRE